MEYTEKLGRVVRNAPLGGVRMPRVRRIGDNPPYLKAKSAEWSWTMSCFVAFLAFCKTARGVVIWFLLAAPLARAVAPNFTLTSPAGAQRGTSVEVTLHGERLADAQEIFFYEPGITVDKIIEAADKKVRAVLAIAPDCPLGEHPLRIRTASGVSPLRLFYVGPFPTVEEKEPNNTLAQAQKVALNSTVEGKLAAEDTDFYAVEAKRGQRISVEIEGARLGRTMLDPQLAIQDRNGRVLGTANGTPLLGHDGYLTLLAPEDGTYFVSVRDLALAGNGHFYRLHVGDFARPALAFPLGARPGQTLTERFLADPAGELNATILVPESAAGSARFPVLPAAGGTPPSPNWIRVVDFPSISNVLAGTSPADAPLLAESAPVGFDGVLAKSGDAAFFRIKAKKDQNLQFEVFARRLGSPIDSVLSVLNAKGATLASNDDAAGYPDSQVRLKIPEDGTYTIKVADQLKRGGPMYGYRVEVTDVKPELILSIPDTARYDYETRKSIVVPRGNRFAVLLNIARDGFGGEVNVACDGLPEGIRMSAAPVPGSVSAVPVVFEAGPEAPIGGRLATPSARPVDQAKAAGVTSRYRHRVEWVRIENDTVYVKSEVNRIAAAVVEELPFKVSIVEPKVPLVQYGEIGLQVVAERAAGFDEPIHVKMLWNPPEVNSPPEVTIAKGATTATYKLNATGKAEANTWKIAMVAGATVKGGMAFVSSQLTPLEIAPAFMVGKMDLTKVERGHATKMTCKLEQKVPFEGKAVARLVGLPAEATAKDVEITKDSTTAEFEVQTSEKTPVGITKNVFCSVTITRDGEAIAQNVAPGSVLRVDPPHVHAKAAVATQGTKGLKD